MFDAIEDMEEESIKEAIKASENPEQSIKEMSDMLHEKTKQLEDEYWERCRFCECGADSILNANVTRIREGDTCSE